MKVADYGIDKPERVRALGMVGLVLMATGFSQFIALQGSVEIWPEMILSIAMWIGTLLWIAAGIMIWSSKVGKQSLAAKMLDAMQWTGREKVIDIGCGKGLLTVLAAHKVPYGSVLGIDVWSQQELSDNSREAAVENAATERVSNRVQFEDGDLTDLNFGPNSFDKVISSLCLHSIGSRRVRNESLEKLIKLVRPGGEIAILDILHTREYQKILVAKGLVNIRLSPMKFLYCMPSRYIIAEKK